MEQNRNKIRLFAGVLFLGICVFCYTALSYVRNSRPLDAAIRRGDMKVVKIKAKKVRDINERIDRFTYLGNCFLLSRNAPREKTPTAGQITEYNNTVFEMIRILVENGADVNAKCEEEVYGRTPLIMAIASGNEDAVKYLLNKGASLKIADNNGRTPLMVAVATTKIPVDLLLHYDNEKSINNQDHEGNTALHILLLSGDFPQTVQLLLEHGADVVLENNEGLTVTEIAQNKQRGASLKVLQAQSSSKESDTPDQGAVISKD